MAVAHVCASHAASELKKLGETVSRFLSLLLVIIFVGGGGLFYAAPVISFYDIRSAARSDDSESLVKLIDYDAIRTDLKAQLLAGEAGVAAPAPSVLNDPVGATGNVLQQAADAVGKVLNQVVNPQAPKTPIVPIIDVDSYLKPKAILALTYGAGTDANVADVSGAKAPAPKIAFFSLEHARLTVKDASHGTTTFTFERHGLTHWQLVHVGLPKPGQDDDAASSSSASAPVSPAG